ncbi:MAG: hypothetical protein M1832_002509 [Thelocarpon impressellum]|nr:MAG: hypothetical protein M1832_002509 [Thelocarpon impressellum]
MAAATLRPLEDRNVRVEDYLDDKLQTTADLDTVESLLRTVRDQQVLLKKQLQEAELSLEEAQVASQVHGSTVLEEAETFQRWQADIDRRLLIVTRSETSDEAAQLFSQSVEKLQRLDLATGYVELLKEADDLRAEARTKINISPQAALEPYLRLQRISKALKALQPAAEDAAPHLIDHVENAANDLWREMKNTLGAEFEKTLAKINWPSRDATVNGELEREWQEGIKKLLDLQAPELMMRDSQEAAEAASQEALVLVPLEVMAKPLELRFRYHFDGDKATNRLDKPEYFMSHINGLLSSYSSFFATYLQPVLSSYFRGSDLALNPVYADSTSALVTALLPMLRRKIFATLPEISGQPQLLSHFMHELMSFDTTLRDEWGYNGGNGVDGWKGLTWEVLVKKDWFGKWLQVERDFALARYQSIIESKDAGEIDYDSVDPGVTKPTRAAIRVNDLLETITDRYRPLASFSQKLRFLIDIQIAIFDKFHNRLHSGLEAYLAATSTVVRAVQGVSKEERAGVEGISGLERLCRIYGSAEYLEKAMADWSDDIFFLELWDELQDRARRSSGKTLAGPMSLEAVAEKTSQTVGSDEDSGALFDETAGAYRKLRVRTEEVMVELLVHNMREALRPYSRINPWSSLDSDPSGPTSTAVSAEIDGPIEQLDDFLSLLSPALAQAPLRRILRQVSLAMQGYLWDYVLMRNSFSSSGARHLLRDLTAVWRVMDKYVGEGQGQLGMKKLREGVTLLNLPMETDDKSVPGLEEAEKRIFSSNEQAREALEQLGMANLTESEARTIVERRVELGS